ncbi:Microtubule-associated protein 70 [Arabidopsis suecica]|jgi:predicted  nucleic acid-binding Zn-ribbon protein|uniref:Microtubule-associated protein 70-5 n=2 Tax=Arabidopsis TaxID=3701 RepID=MP705_ARATH|nr:microtubule-associated proteins 70-5 [Arabidopsis thaliana]Q8GYX3.1 RecName: Full=Microtubule-associated protein 70-5; Short=AtMAP70-5; AltName: Full=70 kDa microtubule-associated protein 5 [Arabidopsis thaliana]KAG7620801.1 Microtubule-associated protein 70 [Arabidopsis suecica]AAO64836.1 At4g17220 [Arabidopsis thaliana]AEE83864.1 microtubule-associated proteins 70-5 [Arabidopsis thaliana]CAJ31082.1 70 kDa microtubule associated protein Type 5 [Arabidopsis thaliana]BAC42006.1 unknown prot|eukprot:NP_193455.2 microtubule-associated proteins 70-5 [Arabidopsis thaliana]
MTAAENPFVSDTSSLQSQLKEKEKELLAAKAEVEALRTNEELKDRVFKELRENVRKLEEKLGATENQVDQKELERKKLEEEKEDALAAQDAAEEALRRVYTHQQDDDSLPLESIIAPLESQIKIHKHEISALQEDKKALERLTKSKESALLEAERILRSALERALIVEEVQNHNFELRRQIEICQDENKFLEKINRQKVLEIEKLSQSIVELEEAILAGGTAANAVRDYRRQISQLNDEKRTLERELARVKVSASRVALAVANEWKDENDRVMPVKQWLEERRILHGEMQKLKDKLAVSERTAKAESQLKERLKLRLKTIEDGLKGPNTFFVSPTTKTEKSGKILGFLTSGGGSKKRSSSQLRGSVTGRIHAMNQPIDRVGESDEMENSKITANGLTDQHEEDSERKTEEDGNVYSEDMVSGFLYDRLQKEVIALRKLCESKEGTINAKNEEIKMLLKKVDALTKAIEVETKKAKREAAAREKENALAMLNEESKLCRKAKLPRSRIPNPRCQ